MMKLKWILFCLVFLVLLGSCEKKRVKENILETVLNNLNQIQSAAYYSVKENWNPGDTAAASIFVNFVKEYDNPSDTTIGAKFANFEGNDTTQLEFCYDGAMRAIVYNDEQRIVVDSFKLNKLSFRPLAPPFYSYVKSIVKYALETKDSISLIVNDQDSCYYAELDIYEENQVEFFGREHYMPESPYTFGNNNSKYELWIDKKSKLPYKVRREMFHNISVITCRNPVLNNLNIEDFNSDKYFQSDYEVVPYGTKRGNTKKSKLLNQIAADWTLETADEKQLSLSDLKSKILMIQFTSISCGPCRLSIPFLKDLPNDYNKSDFDFVAIECTSNSSKALRMYMENNQFNYKFLLANRNVLKDYAIGSYPVFYILNQNRVIVDIIYGYSKESTDQEIKNSINKLLEQNML